MSQGTLFPNLELIAESTSSQEGHPASHSPTPGSVKGFRIRATGGRKWFALLTNSGPLGLLSKMLLGSPTWRSNLYGLIWRGSATGQCGLIFQLRARARHRNGSGSSSWPTPNAGNFNDREEVEHYAARQARIRAEGRGSGFSPPLALAVRDTQGIAWPTPTTQDGTGGGFNQPSQWERNTDPLHVAVVKPLEWTGWPTPVATNAKEAGEAFPRDGGDSLNQAVVKPWPTPHGMADEANPRKQGPSGNELGFAVNQEVKPEDHVPGSLNPDWVDTLQGFPVGWSKPAGPPLVVKPWSTPVAHNATGLPGVNFSPGGDLVRDVTEEQAKPWATPVAENARNYPSATCAFENLNQETLDEAGLEIRSDEQLNPDWVDSLQGFPIGWSKPFGPPLVDKASTHGSLHGSQQNRNSEGSD